MRSYRRPFRRNMFTSPALVTIFQLMKYPCFISGSMIDSNKHDGAQNVPFGSISTPHQTTPQTTFSSLRWQSCLRAFSDGIPPAGHHPNETLSSSFCIVDMGGGHGLQLLVERRPARVLARETSGLRGRSCGHACVVHSSHIGRIDRTRSPHTVGFYTAK